MTADLLTHGDLVLTDSSSIDRLIQHLKVMLLNDSCRGLVFRTGTYVIPPSLQRQSDEDLSAINDVGRFYKAVFMQALARRDRNADDLKNTR